MQSENLISLKDDMIAFISGHGLRRMPAFVTEQVPTVLFEEENSDGWKDFVEHAKAANASFVTMSEVTLEKLDVALLLEQLREHTFSEDDEVDLGDAEGLVKHIGKLGYLQLGFAHEGVVFLFETSTDWYDRFQDLMEAATGIGGVVLDDDED